MNHGGKGSNFFLFAHQALLEQMQSHWMCIGRREGRRCSSRRLRKTKHRGIGRVAANFLLNLIAYNLIRIPKLVAA